MEGLIESKNFKIGNRKSYATLGPSLDLRFGGSIVLSDVCEMSQSFVLAKSALS